MLTQRGAGQSVNASWLLYFSGVTVPVRVLKSRFIRYCRNHD